MLKAHIWKQRQVGMRQEVKIDLFTMDGDPFEAPEVPEVEAWHEVGAGGEPAFSNLWVAAGGANYKPSFRKRPDGIVEMRGLIMTGNSGVAAFTLPVGYRPLGLGNLTWTAMAAATGTGNPTPARLDVLPDGGVVPFIAGTDIVWLALACVRFPTD